MPSCVKQYEKYVTSFIYREGKVRARCIESVSWNSFDGQQAKISAEKHAIHLVIIPVLD